MSRAYLSLNQLVVLELVKEDRPFKGVEGHGQASGRGSTLLSLLRAGMIEIKQPQGYRLTDAGADALLGPRK